MKFWPNIHTGNKKVFFDFISIIKAIAPIKLGFLFDLVGIIIKIEFLT
jgi:hypothetical protein